MRGEHSQKPEEIQDRLEQMYPSATKAEFFARRHRANWDCFGGELKNWNAEQNIK
jgi:N6-adenosine-specific RNA methylase IME4